MKRFVQSGRKTGAGMTRICVTGGIACGKSMVGDCLSKAGVRVCDADEVCRRVMRRGGPAYDAVVKAFGSGLVAKNGELDRQALGRRVFACPEQLERLNRLVHPVVRERVETWIREQRSWVAPRGTKPGRAGRTGSCVAVLIPLVYEVDWRSDWDCVVCVAAPRSIQEERLKERGLSKKEASLRIQAQWPVEEKMKRSDHVIFNSGTKARLKQQTLQVLRHIIEQGEIGHGR